MKERLKKYKVVVAICGTLLFFAVLCQAFSLWQTHRTTRSNNPFSLIVATSTVNTATNTAIKSETKDLLDTYPKARVNMEDFPVLTTDIYSIFFTDGRQHKYLKESRANEAVPIASITKLLTAIIALGNSTFYTVTITPQALIGEGSYGRYQPGDKLYLGEVVKSLLFESDNDAARQLCRDTNLNILPKMNNFATYIGLTDATFYSCSGIDNENGGMNVASARDVIVLLRYLLNNRSEFFANAQNPTQVINRSDSGLHHVALSTYSELVAELPFKVIAAKTGTEVVAKENIVVALQVPKGVVYISLLSSTDRKNDLQKMTDWLYNSYQW